MAKQIWLYSWVDAGMSLSCWMWNRTPVWANRAAGHLTEARPRGQSLCWHTRVCQVVAACDGWLPLWRVVAPTGDFSTVRLEADPWER